MKRTKIVALLVSALFILGLTAPLMLSTTGSPISGIPLTIYNSGTQNTPIQSKQESVNLTIVFHSDLHSELVPWPLADYLPGINNDTTVGGMTRIATMIKQIRASAAAASEQVLAFEVGDFLMGTAFSWAGAAEGGCSPEILLMSPTSGFGLNYTALALGNHEFDYSDHGLSLILNNTDNYKILGIVDVVMPLILCSNLDLSNDVRNLGAYVKPNATITVSGVKIGLFSVIGYGAMATMFFTGSYNILDPIETARQQVEYLSSDPDIDLIICLSHSGWERDVVLAQQVPGIDLILSGHDHEETPEPIRVGNTTIVDSGALGVKLGMLNITVNANNDPGQGITFRQWSLLPINDNITEDAVAKLVVDTALGEIDTVLASRGLPSTREVIANTTTGVPSVGDVPGGETPIGDLVADAIRWMANNVSADDPYVD
ncbi:MAG: bifunctional UDP-sugar hydrolase/5'-nucleotidase, partial [Candidatus Freyarchaeota archaeon]